jgi:hypothetical protein
MFLIIPAQRNRDRNQAKLMASKLACRALTSMFKVCPGSVYLLTSAHEKWTEFPTFVTRKHGKFLTTCKTTHNLMIVG